MPRESATKYWKKQLDRPDISKDNNELIRNGRSPRVDKKWSDYHQEDKDYMDQVIELHHVDYGSEYMELQWQRHRGAGFFKLWHK